MSFIEIPAAREVKVELFKQNGPYGCLPACLANVIRHLKGEALNPDEVDRIFSRKSDTDLIIYDAVGWLLDKGLTVHSLLDPDDLIIEEYLDGKATYDEVLVKFSERYYDGDIAATIADFGSQDYYEFVQRLIMSKPTYDEKIKIFKNLGKYFEDTRKATVEDLNNALQMGQVALVQCQVADSLGHQQLLYSEETGNRMLPTLYNPDEKRPYFATVDVEKMISSGKLLTSETYIISK